MENKRIELDSGSVDLKIYTREDEDSPSLINSIVSDIYKNLPDFNEPITIVWNVTCNDERTIADVLDEYTDKWGEEAFIICKAGTLVHEYQGSIIDFYRKIEQIIGYCLDAYFYRVFFNKNMVKSCGANDICIYSNDKTEDWIAKNMGEDKIIKGFYDQGKIS